MKPKIENKICAVTVTYGNRWNYLSQVVCRLLEFNLIGHVVVVNNGAAYDVAAALDKLQDNRIMVVNHAENEGSAGGYYAGIALAHQQTNDDFIWLLDDDNLPAVNALNELLNAWEALAAAPTTTALYSMRSDRALDVQFARGKNPYDCFLIPNAILGVAYTAAITRKLKQLLGSKKVSTPSVYVKTPYVPYGGFFVHRAIVDVIGYPNKDFYLYVDDEEYTYRVSQRGANIYMVTTSTISDIDTADGRVSYKPVKWASPMLDLWSFRMYYRVRNSVYFHNQISLTNRFEFNINKNIFLLKQLFLAVVSGKFHAYKKLKAAIADGINGRLGKANPSKF